MAIISTDVKFMLSGGSGNTTPAASLGGAASTTTQGGTNIFDAVDGSEAAAGDIEYRCEYVKNTHGTLIAIGVKFWVQANTPSADTTIDIGLGTSAVSGTEQTVANENTAPTGVTFSAPTVEASGLVIGDLAPGATKAIWIRRTVTAGAAPANDTCTLRVGFDTNP